MSFSQISTAAKEYIDKEEVYSVNLLDAVRFVYKACEHIPEKTIWNCFRHAGIIQEEVSTEIESSVATTEEDEDDLPLSECVSGWIFPSVDDDILTTETLTAGDIVTEVKNQQNSASDEENLQEEEEEEDSEEQEIEVNVPTINEAFKPLRWWIIFMKQHQKMCN